jgi:hypothetical protein
MRCYRAEPWMSSSRYHKWETQETFASRRNSPQASTTCWPGLWGWWLTNGVGNQYVAPYDSFSILRP